jgi:hypothetical protein
MIHCRTPLPSSHILVIGLAVLSASCVRVVSPDVSVGLTFLHLAEPDHSVALRLCNTSRASLSVSLFSLPWRSPGIRGLVVETSTEGRWARETLAEPFDDPMPFHTVRLQPDSCIEETLQLTHLFPNAAWGDEPVRVSWDGDLYVNGSARRVEATTVIDRSRKAVP